MERTEASDKKKKKKKKKENNFPSVINCASAPCTSISTCSANNRENTTLLKKIKTSKQKPVKKGGKKEGKKKGNIVRTNCTKSGTY